MLSACGTASNQADGNLLAEHTDCIALSKEYEQFLWKQNLYYLAWLNPAETAVASDIDDLSITRYCLKLMLDNGLSFPQEKSGFMLIPLDTMQEYAEKYLGILEYLPASLPTVPKSGGLSAAFDRQRGLLYVSDGAPFYDMSQSAHDCFRPGGISDLGGGMISARVEFFGTEAETVRFIDYVFDASDPENPVFISSTETWVVVLPTPTGEYLRLTERSYVASEYIPYGAWLSVTYVPYMVSLSLIDMHDGEVIETASHEYSSGPENYDMSPEIIFTPDVIAVKLQDGLRLFGYDLSNRGFIPVPDPLSDTWQFWDFTVSPNLKTLAFTDDEGVKTVPLDGSEPPHLIFAHPKPAQSDDYGQTAETLGRPSFLLDGNLIVCSLNFEERMLARFYAAEPSGENLRLYDTDKDIEWHKNFYAYARDEWLITPRIKGNLAALSLLTGETRIIGNESENADQANYPVSSGRYLAYTERVDATTHLYLYDWESGESSYTGFSVADDGDLHAGVHLIEVDEFGRVLLCVSSSENIWYSNDIFLVTPAEQ